MSRSVLFVALVATALAIGHLARASAQGNLAVQYSAVSRINTGAVTGVAAADGIAYVTDAIAGLIVFDMSDPSTPTELGRSASNGSAAGIVLDGHLALVVDGPGAVSIFDVTDPASPRRQSTLRLGEPEKALAAASAVGAVPDMLELAVFDYADPGAPREVSRVGFGYDVAEGVDLSQNLAFVALFGERLAIVDLTDPAAPQPRGLLGEGDNPFAFGNSVDADGTRVYLGERLGGTFFIPTPVPPTPGPSPTGATLTPPPVGTAPPDGGRLTVVDASDPDAPEAVGHSEAFYNDPIGVVHAAGNLVWTVSERGTGWPRLIVLDVSDPASPVTAEVEFDPPLPYDLGPRFVTTDGDLVYIAGSRGLEVLQRQAGDVETPTPTGTGQPTSSATATAPAPATATVTSTPELTDGYPLYLPAVWTGSPPD